MLLNNYQTILQNEFIKRMKINNQYSLRSFAKFLNQDPTSISQILSGKRKLSYKKAMSLIISLKLNENDKNTFLNSLAVEHIEKNKIRINPNVKKLINFQKTNSNNKSKSTSFKNIELEQFSIISEWYHYAILELAETPRNFDDPKLISKIFGISTVEAKSALERLEELGLIVIKNNKIFKTFNSITTRDKHLTTVAHKKRQQKILEKSIHALNNQAIESRNHSTMTLAIDPCLIPEAKNRIEQFMNDLTDFLQSSKKNTEIYELAINLFSLESMKKK